MAKNKKLKGKASRNTAGKTKRLAKAALGLAAAALLETAVQRAADNPRVRRKARSLGRAIASKVKMAGRKVVRAAHSSTEHRREEVKTASSG